MTTINVSNQYLINRYTMAIKPATQLNFDSIVYESESQKHVRQLPVHLLDQACIPLGSTYKGRTKAIAKLLQIRHKVPVLISERELIVGIPTHSPTHPDCHWLFYHHIESCTPIKNDNKKSLITFHNGTELIVPVSSLVIRNQMNRAAMLIILFSRLF